MRADDRIEALRDTVSELLSMDEPRTRFAAMMSGPWAQRVSAIDADYPGDWELPALGQVAAPAAVLIRPDGYVAWVGDGTDT